MGQSHPYISGNVAQTCTYLREYGWTKSAHTRYLSIAPCHSTKPTHNMIEYVTKETRTRHNSLRPVRSEKCQPRIRNASEGMRARFSRPHDTHTQHSAVPMGHADVCESNAITQGHVKPTAHNSATVVPQLTPRLVIPSARHRSRWPPIERSVISATAQAPSRYPEVQAIMVSRSHRHLVVPRATTKLTSLALAQRDVPRDRLADVGAWRQRGNGRRGRRRRCWCEGCRWH